MKYYDTLTRKRPEFNQIWVSAHGYILCQCGTTLQSQQVAFEHWQQGHFDVYDEYVNKAVEREREGGL